MRVNQTVLNGIRGLFGATGRVVWVYGNDPEFFQYLALDNGIEPPPIHPRTRKHQLAGSLDLRTGVVAGPKVKTTTTRSDTEVEDLIVQVVVGVLTVAKYLFIGVILAGVVLVSILSTPIRRS